MATLAVDVGLVALGVAGLWLGAGQFVGGATRLARRLGVPGLVIGLTVVAFGTSAPEFAVTIGAALAGRTDISVANVVGSNVVNLGFILGGTALVRALPVATALVRRDALVMVGTVLALLAVVRDLAVSRLEGGLLFVGLVGYLVVLARTGGDRVVPVPTAPGDPEFRWYDLVRLVAGLAVVVAGAQALVLGAADLARLAGLSEWVIGATVVALGTSAPEFVTSVAAVSRGRTNLSAGNIVGSCIFNALGVLGLAGALRPLPVADAAVEATLWLLAVSVVATLLFRSRGILSRIEGGLLVVLNAVDWLVDVVPVSVPLSLPFP